MAVDTELQDKDKTGNDNPSDKDKKVELTPEQQEHVNTIFNQRFAKITAKYESAQAALQAEIDKLKNPIDKDKDKDKDKDTDNDPAKQQFKNLLEAEKNKAKLAEVEMKKAKDEAAAARAESMRTRKEVAIAKAATKQNFYELDVVQRMVWDNIEFDEDTKTFVIKENGVVRQNSSLVPMTLEEYFNEFAAHRPYLVNGDVKSGTGAADSKTTNAGLVKSKKDLRTAKEKADFIAKFGLQKFEDLPLQ